MFLSVERLELYTAQCLNQLCFDQSYTLFVSYKNRPPVSAQLALREIKDKIS